MSKHTFVIAAYKESPYLETCILNLLNQTAYGDLIITTSTPNIFIENLAKKYSLSYIVNTLTQTSIANDWNFALSQSKTKYVTIAHQDDIYDLTYREEFLKQLKHSPDSVIAFSNYRDLVENKLRNTTLNKKIKQALLSPFLIKSVISSKLIKKMILSLGSPICCPSVTFNKEGIKDFQFSSAYTCTLDWAAWLTLANQKGNFIYINKELVQHRIHQQSETTAQLINGKRGEEEAQILTKIWGKNIGKMIAKFYSKGHKENII